MLIFNKQDQKLSQNCCVYWPETEQKTVVYFLFYFYQFNDASALQPSCKLTRNSHCSFWELCRKIQGGGKKTATPLPLPKTKKRQEEGAGERRAATELHPNYSIRNHRKSTKTLWAHSGLRNWMHWFFSQFHPASQVFIVDIRHTTSQNSSDPLSVSGKCFGRLLNFSATAHLTVINHWWTCSWTVRSLWKYLLCHYRLCDVHASVSASHSALWNFKQRAKQLWPSRWDSICTDTDSSVATGLTVPCSHWKII